VPLGLWIAVLVAWMGVNLVLASKAAEYRIDTGVRREGGMGNDLQSVRSRFDPANYSPAGRRWRIAFTLSCAAQALFAFGGLFLIRL
jgi:hypothetical protein